MGIASPGGVEFVSVVTCSNRDKPALLTKDEARRQGDCVLREFPVIYPTENTLRTALRGAALDEFSWFDAHRWPYAHERGLETIGSEDSTDGSRSGRVPVRNPFRAAVNAPPAPVCRD
jgi:predicted nucleic acid-binding protein